ncbi:MAG: AMP-binding protein [Lachnospiraceae bacterium]|uniref:AMP-binding protein n=1 Tax=Candidatus Merdisoma sp. JLR.KK011 TaxID=3114299 RepID=UPI002FF07A5D|nr:AMP-binding protein [Lachnospiraceae bacterium]
MWNFEAFSQRIAVINEEGQSLNYQELQEESRRLGEALGKRCLVFILCSNTIGAFAGYAGCITNRSVPLLLAQNLDKELLQHLIETYKPDYLWAPAEMKADFPKAAVRYEAFDFVLLETGDQSVYRLRDELCLLLTTSGSTGSPKLVRQSYQNVFANAQSIAEYLKLDETERPITTLPMNYTYGLSIINSHLLVGAAVLITDKTLVQKEFWKFFKEAGATSFGGVPYTYEMLDRMRFMGMELPSLRTMTQAGGKLTPELHEKFARFAQEHGKKFVVMYGQCEATARMGYLPAEKAVEKKGSMGIAIPGGKFYLIDTQGKEVTVPHTTGELVYEGENVTLGYAECGEELSKGDERGGVLYTGDMAQFDEDGYYYIVGRKKRFLKIYGNRVNLDEIERLIKGKFGIEAASAGIDDHLYLFVLEEAVTEAVKRFVAEKTGLNPAAFHVKTIKEIPKNDSGKIQYRELENYYER